MCTLALDTSQKTLCSCARFATVRVILSDTKAGPYCISRLRPSNQFDYRNYVRFSFAAPHSTLQSPTHFANAGGSGHVKRFGLCLTVTIGHTHTHSRSSFDAIDCLRTNDKMNI